MNQEQIYKLIKQGNIEAAIKALFENIEQNPQEVENYINAGILIAEAGEVANLSLIHISEPTRRTPISYAVFCLKKKSMPSSA